MVFRTTGLQHKLLISNPQIYFIKNQQKKAYGLRGKVCWQRGKVDMVLRQSLGQIRPNVVKKAKILVLSVGFFIFCMKNIFKSKK